MKLNLGKQQFLVCGATSGFGRAVAESLLEENASVILVARSKDKLDKLADKFPSQVQFIAGDLTKVKTLDEIETTIESKQLHGAFINAGGPPALSALETSMERWDEAYQSVMRWKIDLASRLIPHFTNNNYGRLLFLESQSIKQPIPSLVLSNAFRAGIAGFAKTLALEVAKTGITVNILAPGSHNTPAIERVIQKKVKESDKTFEEVKENMEQNIPVGRMGEGEELASLATWLLSSKSGFITGQTISHDGGNIKSLFG